MFTCVSVCAVLSGMVEVGGGEEGGWEGGREVELAGGTFSSAKEILIRHAHSL